MTTMIAEVYEAFKEANVSDERARKVSEAIAAYEWRFASLDVKIEKLDGRMSLMMWQQAITFAGVLTLIGGVGSPMIKAFNINH